MDGERAVAVREEEAAIVEEREVRRHEAVAAPLLGGLRVLFRGVLARFDRRELPPDRLSLERQLGERLHLLIRADVEELLAPLLANLDAVATPLELGSERRMYFPSASNTKIDGWSLRSSRALVDDVQVPRESTATLCVVCQVNLSGSCGQSCRTS